MEAIRIESKGGSQAKGRNGNFKLHTTLVEESYPATKNGTGRIWLSFLSNRAEWPGAAYAILTPDDAEAIGKALVEMAVLVRGSFV